MGLEEKKPEKKKKLGSARWIVPVAACLLIGVAGTQVLRLQGDRIEGTDKASVLEENAPAKKTVKTPSGDNEKLEGAPSRNEALEGTQDAIEVPVSDEAVGASEDASGGEAKVQEAQVKEAQANVSETTAAGDNSDTNALEVDSLLPQEKTLDLGGQEFTIIEEEAEPYYYMEFPEEFMEESAPETFAAEYSYFQSPLYGAPPRSFGKGIASAGYMDTEGYAPIQENEFQLTSTQPLSTFAADVDTASYGNVRRMIENGYGAEDIYPDAVRVEEFVNYFSYQIPDPQEGEIFGSAISVIECPWNSSHELLFVGLKTEDIDLSEAPSENLTFLLDVSGSMEDSDKLPLVKRAFLSLIEELGEDDTISIVTYANGVEVLLDSVKGDQKDEIRKVIENLEAAGGTNGEGGIQKAYELAEKNFQEKSNNRILLATDGDLNIGISEPEELKKFIKDKKDHGIFLSVLGFGTGNIQDDNMEALADSGNGSYHYIDSLLEAKKVLVEELGSSLHVVAKDVKLQLEFNPSVVNAYRQLGYENRQMAATDFRNDQKDGGEVGAGGRVIVLYELIPASSPEAITLTYGSKDTGDSTDYATLRLRYKLPQEDTATESSIPIPQGARQAEGSEDARFAAAVAELALLLRDDSQLGETASLEHVQTLLSEMDLTDEYRQEFAFLVRLLVKRAS